MKKIVLSLVFLGLTGMIFAQGNNSRKQSEEATASAQYKSGLEKYNRGMLDYREMPQLARAATQRKDSEVANRIADDYISNYLIKLEKEELFTKDHLQFISDYMGGTSGKGFMLFTKNKEKINAVLGIDRAEYLIRSAIANDFLPKPSSWETDKPNWSNLEKIVNEKFGALGLEVVYGHQMIYYKTVQDWQHFGKYFVLYFEKALKRPEYMINNIAWSVFEKVEDQKVLESAIAVMKYDIETWDQQAADAYDTYANLLHKAGKKNLAIEWEEKAVKLKNGAPDQKVYVETLEKIRRGEKTW